jgi:hypothetical protein
MNIISLNAMKSICYFYGAFSLVAQFSMSPQKTPFWIITLVSFTSVAIFIFIMLRFKEELNRRLKSVKMDNVIILMVYLAIGGYAISILGRAYPENIVSIQFIFGIGGLVLDIIYAVFLKRLDAPLEKLAEIKSLNIYSNCILAAMIMALTIVGMIFAIFLISFSYFILGNIFLEMKSLEAT